MASLITRCTKKDGRANKWATAKKRNFRWAGFTNFLNEVYLNMAFAVCINVSVFGADTNTTVLMTILSIIVGLLEICWPIVVVWDLNKTMNLPMPQDPLSLEGGEAENNKIVEQKPVTAFA